MSTLDNLSISREERKSEGCRGRLVVGTDVVRMPIGELAAADSPRADGEDGAHIADLADTDTKLPAIVVHRTTGRVIDGMHRLRAARLRGDSCIEVRFFDGTEDDAFVLAVELNIRHGLPLSRADRKAAAVRIMRSHSDWSDRAIAESTGLSDKTVASLRRCSTAESPQSNRRLGRDGRSRPTDAGEGRRRAHELLRQNPDLSLRTIAEQAGISVSTAKDVRDRERALPASADTGRQGCENEPIDWPPCSAGPVTRGTGGYPTPTSVPSTDLRAELSILVKDPSIRQSDAGRDVLRILNLVMIQPGHWAKLAAVLQPHCRPRAASVARECSVSLLNFAELLVREQPSGARSLYLPAERHEKRR